MAAAEQDDSSLVGQPVPASEEGRAMELMRDRMRWLQSLKSFTCVYDQIVDYKDGTREELELRVDVEMPGKMRITDTARPDTPLLVCDGSSLVILDALDGSYVMAPAWPTLGETYNTNYTGILLSHLWDARGMDWMPVVGLAPEELVAATFHGWQVQWRHQGQETLDGIQCHHIVHDTIHPETGAVVDHAETWLRVEEPPRAIRQTRTVSYPMEAQVYERPGTKGLFDLASVERRYHTFTPNAILAEDTFDLPAGATGAPN
jgi:hypothetical protein